MEKNPLHYISYGMYIVASLKSGKYNGQIANAIIQVTNNPDTLAISINKSNLTNEFMEASGLFSVSTLNIETSLRFIGRFGFKSGRDVDKFSGTGYEVLASGCPAVTENALCYYGGKIVNKMDCGTYNLFLGEITESRLLEPGRVMTYNYYHEEKCGKTPETAPTFIEGEKTENVCKIPGRYRCTVCNYIYNPELGDPDGGIAPGTSFEDIPDDWTCPICGVDKSKFVKME